MASKSLIQWNLIHSFLLISGGVISILFELYWPVYLIGTLSFTALMARERNNWMKLHPFGGYANHLTLLRLLLLLAIVFLANPYVIFALLLVSIILDAFDGVLARKHGTSSEFGSFLDIETDAFFMLILTLSLYQLNLTGSWIIHAGLSRYYYILLKRILGLSKIKEPRLNSIRYTAIAVFVLFFSPFVIPEGYYHLFLAIGTSLLILSFSASFINLVRIAPAQKRKS